MALELTRYKQDGFWLNPGHGQVVHTDITVRLRNPQFYPLAHPAREIDWTRGFIPGEALASVIDYRKLRLWRSGEMMLAPGVERNNYELLLADVISEVTQAKKGSLGEGWRDRRFNFGSFWGDIFHLCAGLGCLAYVVGEVAGVERFFNIERWSWLMPNVPQYTHDVVKLLSLFIGTDKIVRVTNYFDQTTAASRILRDSIPSLPENYAKKEPRVRWDVI